MAIYHLEAKVISRGVGRSAVAASAYMSCSAIYNDYDGIQHDYTKKQGLVYERVFLPTQAPIEWQDRSILWNVVEETEKSKDSRLAREFVVALPVELNKEQQISLLTEYVQESFVDDGMCADSCIHDTDGHNPHAPIMLTVRPLSENGKWQNKTEKEYLCVKDGEEQGFTAVEFKSAQVDGWEKQYQFFVEKKKVYMPPSAAEAQNLERVSKYPKSTKYGRQNPITERWNSEQELILWREKWAEVTNKYLEMVQAENRIDYRSNAERGIDEQPTIHEGVSARIMEQRGYTSEKCEINKKIKEDNRLLRTIKAQIKRLLEAVKNTIPSIANALEKLRSNMIFNHYNIKYSAFWKNQKYIEINAMKTNVKNYTEVTEELKAKLTERKDIQAQKKATPIIQIFKHKEFSRIINDLSEQIEELRTQKKMLLQKLKCFEDKEISRVKARISDLEKGFTTMEKHIDKCTSELDGSCDEFARLKEQAQEFDVEEIRDYRLDLRPQAEQQVKDDITKIFGDSFSSNIFKNSKDEIDIQLDENLEKGYLPRSIRKHLERYEQQKQQNNRPNAEHDDNELEL